ncbi:MAG: alpha/beta fold hydrolase [Acidimicrobiales bacterium]
MTDPTDIRIPVAPRVQLHARLWGTPGASRPSLLVHGLASNARTWDGVAQQLAEWGHPVAAIDQRGHGLSDKPDEGYDFPTLCADLLAVIENLGWRGPEHKPVVVGQSWGGNVVLAFGSLYPDVPAALVLVDGGTIDLASAYPTWEETERLLAPPNLSGTPVVDFERRVRRGHLDWPEAGIEGTLANMEVLSDGTIAPHLSRAHHMTILKQLWLQHPEDLYPKVQVPVLIVPATGGWSAGDPEPKQRATDAAVARLARAEVHWMEGDHDLHAQHPRQIAELIQRAAGLAGADPGSEPITDRRHA